MYKTPDGLDDILLNSDGEYLTGLWFFGSKGAFKHCVNCEEKMLPIFDDSIRWLNVYFRGSEPDFIPCHRVVGAMGSLFGYGGGIESKKSLLSFERINNNR